MRKRSLLWGLCCLGILLTACTDSATPIASKSSMFKLGETDGCATANGGYTKNSDYFRGEPDYAKGWFEGRKKCNPSYSSDK